jgi:tetratricopeptide (TPR) repeat protein
MSCCYMRRLTLFFIGWMILGCAPQPGISGSPASPTPVSDAEVVESLFQSALHKLRKNDVEGGLKDLRLAAEVQPDNPEVVKAYSGVAERMHRIRRTDHALKVIELAIEMRPEDSQFWHDKGVFLLAEGEMVGARKALVKARELAPEDAGILFDMGWQSSQDPETYQRALEEYTLVIEMDKTFKDAWTYRGSLRNRMNNHEAALKDLDQALKLEPEDPVAIFEKAVALSALGNKEEARRLAEKVIAMNRNQIAVLAAKKLLRGLE